MASLFLKAPKPVGYAVRRKYVPTRLSEVMAQYLKRSGGTKPPWQLYPRLIEHRLKAQPRFTKEQFGLIRQKAVKRAVQNAVRRRQK